ncbi:MAG: metallopeptidase TldD-related protein [Bdellovibrionota bacterium]
MISNNPWNLEQLKSELERRKEVNSWVITQEHVHRRERYFMLDCDSLVVDQDRDVQVENISLKLATPLSKSGRQGEITKKLFQALPLSAQIDSAIQAARETDHQEWQLPLTVPKDIPHRATADPAMSEDLESVVNELTQEIRSVVLQKRPTRFNSAELFLSTHRREVHLSNGLVHRGTQTRVYAESAFSRSDMRDGKLHSDEYLNTRWAVNRADLKIGELFDETSDRAAHMLDVSRPKTGRYPVIVDSEVLLGLLNGHMSQLSGANSYHGLPFVKPGDDLIPGASGDLLTITLDPSLEYGADTTAVSEQGLIQSPLRLVEKNKVIQTATDKQFADYLGTKATTTCGNVVVDPGKSTHEQLTKSALAVVEILQFSAIVADPNSGTFSSEIRLAKHYDNRTGRVTYLKGGSLSGSIKENFKGLRLSNDQVKRATFSANASRGQGYFGPSFALLSDVSIVGD